MLARGVKDRSSQAAVRRWAGRAIVVATVAVATAAGGAAPSAGADDDALASDITIPAAGPLGPVTVIGDSVLLGSGLYGPTLPDRLADEGWGPIVFRAAVGKNTGSYGGNPSTTAPWWIERWRSSGWNAPNVIVNLGSNDSGVCGTNLTCARESILLVVDAIGPGHRIWWPQITRARVPPGVHEMITWNTALRQIADERADFFTWDWPAEMDGGGYPTSDGVHLTVDGYRSRSAAMAEQFTADLVRAERVGGDVPLPAATATASTFVPVTPERIIDTRTQAPGRRPDGSTLPVDFGDRLPPGATAVAVNVTAAAPTGQGYLSAGPCGAPIDGSTVNFTSTSSRGAMAVTPLGLDDDVCIFNRGETDVIVDLQGVFVDGPGGVGLTPLGTHQRLVDTRRSTFPRFITVPTPPGATAVAVNLTAIGVDRGGWVRAAPCGSESGVSNVNFGGGEIVAGAAFVATSADDTICIETSVNAAIIVDLTATFGPGGLRFVPVVPTRMLDTRDGTGGWSPIQGAGQTIGGRVAPPEARAVTGTVTQVSPVGTGFLVAHSCGDLPPTSSVNADRGQILANSATTAVAPTGWLCVYSHEIAHTLFDVTGWWVP